MAGVITVDPSLIHDVRSYGRFDVGACFNCGSCTITCAMTEGSAAFPRRVIRSVHAGAREVLLSSLDPWLCDYCGDCSKACPRQAEPGEAMMTLRRYLSSQYDRTGLSGRLHRSAAWRLFANLGVGALTVLLVILFHLETRGLDPAFFFSTPMGLEHMFSGIIYFTLAVFAMPLVFLLASAFSMHACAMNGREKAAVPLRLYLVELRTLLLHAFTQKRMLMCSDKPRWIRHLSLFFGFLLSSVLMVFFLRWFQTDAIYPIHHPQRWLGYLAAAALVYGSLESLIGRSEGKAPLHRFSEIDDWMLPVLLLLTALSGIAIHVFRYLGFAFAAHYAFFAHIAIVVPMLVVEIPFGKLAHMVHRPLAVYFQAVKDRALRLQAPGGEKTA